MKIKINTKAIESAAREALQDACLIAHREIVQVISDTGAFPDFPGRDIVDTGALRASQQPPTFEGDKAVFRNTVDYALYVYLGYTLRNGRSQPGRPWMHEGIKRANFAKTFELLLKSKL